MRLFALRGKLNDDTKARINSLQQACKKRDVEYLDVDVQAADFSNPSRPNDGDLLFQLSIAPAKLGYLMIHEKVSTVYKDVRSGMVPTHQLIPHEKAGIPMPRTIHKLTREHNRLSQYVEACGGFPVILKARGGTHGVGVMKIDSFSSLVSVLDYISTDSDVVMRQFIETHSSERLVVLGDKVVASYRYHRQGEDIRANAGASLKVEAMEYPAAMQADAVRAVHVLGIEHGGVDMLLDDNGNHYLLETNTPFCNIGRAIEATGIDVGDLIVQYLVDKSEKIMKHE